MPLKTDYLRFHRGRWQVRIFVPVDVRAAFGGKTVLMQDFGPDLNAANRLKGEVVSRFHAMIQEARCPGDPLMKEALALRRRLDESRNDQEEIEALLLANRLGDRIEQEQGGNAAENPAYKLATGFNTPIDHYVGQWLAAKGFVGKTAMQHRMAINALIGWCASTKIEATLQAVTKRVARDFIAKDLRVRLATSSTVNRYLSTYRTYWAWLMRDDRMETNPWDHTHITERSLPHDDDDGDDDDTRPFTDYEIRKLLAGSPSEPLPDLIRTAALTGARIDALCNLRVRDCAGGNFHVRKAKKEKRARTVPIHPGLAAIVAKRMSGKKPDDFLFHELPAATDVRPRSGPASKAFTRYRRKLKVDERAEGQRQSNVNFHSWRRWFITMAERAGQPVHIIEKVVGHKRSGMSLDVYSQGPSIEQLRACVEAVQLPSFTTADRPATL